MRTTLGLTLVLALAACAQNTAPTDLPAFSGNAYPIGALMCLSSSFAARAPDIEKTIILAEEFINGSTWVSANPTCRSLAGESPTDPHACGVWVGQNADGASLRGPLQVVVADGEERADRTVAAAQTLQDTYNVQALIGPCDYNSFSAVFSEPAQATIPSINPFITTDALSTLDHGSRGYFYRTLPPDYIQVQILGLVGANKITSKPLSRYEDELDDCTTQPSNFCDKYTPAGSYSCVTSRHSAMPARNYIKVTTQRCDAQPSGYCDNLGIDYDCIGDPNAQTEQVCAQYQLRKFCTKLVNPVNAIVLYENSEFGLSTANDITNYWQDFLGNHVLASVAYTAGATGTFAGTIAHAFTTAQQQFTTLQANEQRVANANFADTVVFLFAQAADGALLLEQWVEQKATLPPGSNQVFWLSTDALLSDILTTQVPFKAIRNMFVTLPTTLSINNAAFFEDLYSARWGTNPGHYAGNVFDAIALVALANERAGYKRAQSETGALGPNLGSNLKGALRAVSAGCTLLSPESACTNVYQNFQADGLAHAMDALRHGFNVQYVGVTGDLSFTPAGDRLASIDLWRVQAVDEAGDFFQVDSYSPQSYGIRLQH